MKKCALIFIICITTLSCSTKKERDDNEAADTEESFDEPEQNNQDDQVDNSYENDYEESEVKYSDGTYCAEVSYYNQNTGTHSSYTLTVEIESNELVQINWPNRGWLDNDHFNGAELDDDGNTSFTSDKGYDYEVQITGDAGNCFTDVPMAQQCRGTTEDGDQCENMTDNQNGLCWQHQDQE